MTPTQSQKPPDPTAINSALRLYSDKDWNYSRISLETRTLESLDCPYVLWIEEIDVKTPVNRKNFKSCEDEVTWGARHSNELGILELISLRINKALIESTSDEHWNYRRPVVRLIKREELVKKGITDALWYQVTEVIGDEFDSR
ncbi:MAG: hypothetical protein WCS70_04905 [Verrucomicrobiota bacterium]